MSYQFFGAPILPLLLCFVYSKKIIKTKDIIKCNTEETLTHKIALKIQDYHMC